MATLYIVYSVQQYRDISQPRSLKLRFVNQLLKLLFTFIIKHNVQCTWMFNQFMSCAVIASLSNMFHVKSKVV